MTLPDTAALLEALRPVHDPELHRSIVDLGMVKELGISPDGLASFTLALTIPSCPLRERMSAEARQALLAVPGVRSVEITFGVLDEAERIRALGPAAAAAAHRPLPALAGMNRVERVIAVMSGKGGVGKSTVTGLLAVALARRGLKAGILDGDLTGPSIPMLFGLPPGGLRGGELGMLPAFGPLGIRVVSANLLLPEADAALMWRGPLISATIKQFWEKTLWGRLDVLLVDLPPGTGDASLAVVQNLPLDAALLVTGPQALSALIVSKAVHMLQQFRVDIAGVVENYAYFADPDGTRHALFGPSHAQEVAAAAGAPLLARLPIVPGIAELGDAGRLAEAGLPEIDALAAELLERVPVKTAEQTKNINHEKHEKHER